MAKSNLESSDGVILTASVQEPAKKVTGQEREEGRAEWNSLAMAGAAADLFLSQPIKERALTSLICKGPIERNA